MKVTVNIECTPEEARAFFGLPDVQPMQEHLMKEMQERLSANLKAMDPDAMIKAWLPTAVKGFAHWQDIVASHINPARAK
jgi:hypothetical protein